MEDDAPVIYGLEFQARALAAHTAETEKINFLVGTQSLRNENQVHLLNFDDETNILHKKVFVHPGGEIWHISSCPVDSNVIGTVFNKITDMKAEMKAALWRIPQKDIDESDDRSSGHLEEICSFDTTGLGDMKSLVWHPSGEDSQAVSILDNHLALWDIDVSSSCVQKVSSVSLEGKGQSRLSALCWNPHHNCQQVMTGSDSHIKGWDLRSMSQTYSIENAHQQLVRDLNFNPNRQYYLASCGDDCKAKFWDIRHPKQPLKVLQNHSHWIWAIRFNHFHDQLVLTSSSDSRVILHNVQSISSEPLGHFADDDIDEAEQKAPIPDGVIATYEEHEDSVYSVEWSTADPWTFASLSYDGRLVINKVPRTTKYKILL